MQVTKQFIKEHPNIIVSRADKGGATVLVTKDEYIGKMTEIFTNVSM